MIDVIIVGAGVNGLSTAYYLAAKEKKTVLLIEQFPFPHTRGSSTGHSRITRKFYKQKHFSDMMREAMPMWDEIETLSGFNIYRHCGMLYVGTDQSGDKFVEIMKANNFAYEDLSYEQILERFPQYSGFDNCNRFVYDPSAGVLLADKCLLALHKLFINNGGNFHENEKVLSITPNSFGVLIKTNVGEYRSKSVIVTANTWTKQIMENMGVDIPVHAEKVCVTYWRLKDPNDKRYHVDNKCPTFMTDIDNHHIYGLPELEYPGCIKFCNHSGSLTTPDNRDWASHNQDLLDSIKKFIQRYIPQVHPEPAIVETCMYCSSPDETYIIDKHPQYPQIVFATGFSGTGFKTAPVVGKILSCMALNKESGYDLNVYCLNRFSRSRAKL